MSLQCALGVDLWPAQHRDADQSFSVCFVADSVDGIVGDFVFVTLGFGCEIKRHGEYATCPPCVSSFLLHP
jgi:hypothetical protein